MSEEKMDKKKRHLSLIEYLGDILCDTINGTWSYKDDFLEVYAINLGNKVKSFPLYLNPKAYTFSEANAWPDVYMDCHETFCNFSTLLDELNVENNKYFFNDTEIVNSVMKSLYKTSFNKYHDEEHLILKGKIITLYANIVNRYNTSLQENFNKIIGYDPFQCKIDIDMLNDNINKMSRNIIENNKDGVFNGLIAILAPITNYATNIQLINDNIIEIYSNVMKPLIEETERSINAIKNESKKGAKLTIATAVISIAVTLIFSILSIVYSS